MGFLYNTADPILYTLLHEFAKENKKHQTEAESFLWQQIRASRLGVRFKRQHVIDRFIADFVCLEHKLIIEVDGGYHSMPEQVDADEARSEVLNHYGFRILRFKNEEIIGNIDVVLKSIKDHINE